MTTRGQILVSSTDDDPLPSVCGFKTSPCVRSKRPRVYRHHAYMFQHMCAWCRHTRGRLECTHGDVLNLHTVTFLNPHTGFPRFFSVPQHTHTHQTHTTTTKQHHDHNDTHHTTQHNTQHHMETDRERERDRERETERDRERQRETERERQDKTREDGTRQEDKKR